MKDMVEVSAKTVQEAVDIALEELGAQMDDVEIDVIDEGTKGIFGIGSKDARVSVKLKNSQKEHGMRFLRDVLDKMNVSVDVEGMEEEDALLFKISGKDSGIVIGRRGETLDALQYLTSLVVNKRSNGYKRVTIDIENYRQRREETLVRLAGRLAQRVVRNRRSITLEPMNPYERRIIHSALQNNNRVETYSVGEEPNRKVVITPRQGAGLKRK
ncbi:MAG: RNA-binding cell elongation regulator Jag/EloR [Acetivibrionales bacterium]|jgi:spoIIIJ-associated protein